MIGDFLYHIAGLSNSGPWYAFWSGFGSDVSELSLLFLPFIYFRHHRCHAPRCVRIGHPNDIGVVVCRRHIEAQW